MDIVCMLMSCSCLPTKKILTNSIEFSLRLNAMCILKWGCNELFKFRILRNAIHMLIYVLLISGLAENDKAAGSDASNTRTGLISCS